MRHSSLVVSWVLTQLVTAVSTWSFEAFPEFNNLTEEEQSEFEGPTKLNSEYAADLSTYEIPERWQYRLLSEDQVLSLNTGSLDGTHFLMDNRLKIHAPLNKWVEFRFTYFDDRNFDYRSLHHVAEFIARPSKWLGLGIYSELDHFKRKPDTGVALFFYPRPNHEIRVFNTFVDVTLLKRNDQADRHILPHLPYARGVVGRIIEESGDYFQYAGRYETKTKWQFPDEAYIYDYWRGHASALLSKGVSSRLRLHTQLEFDRKFEAKHPTDSTSSVVAEAWITTRIANTWGVKISGIGPKRKWDYASKLSFARRLWDTTKGRAYYRDFVFSHLVGLPGFARVPKEDRWHTGPTIAWHRSAGETSLFDSDQKSNFFELRWHLIYEFRFEEKASLRIIASADLNEFGTSESWDGGNAQFLYIF